MFILSVIAIQMIVNTSNWVVCIKRYLHLIHKKKQLWFSELIALFATGKMHTRRSPANFVNDKQYLYMFTL